MLHTIRFLKSLDSVSCGSDCVSCTTALFTLLSDSAEIPVLSIESYSGSLVLSLEYWNFNTSLILLREQNNVETYNSIIKSTDIPRTIFCSQISTFTRNIFHSTMISLFYSVFPNYLLGKDYHSATYHQ